MRQESPKAAQRRARDPRVFMHALSGAVLVCAFACKGTENVVGGPVGPAAAIIRTGGDSGIAAAGVGVVSLRARVVDASGAGVSGVPLTWRVTGGGSISTSQPSTTAGGTANAQWTLGNVFGVESATVSVTGIPPLTFVATATMPTTVRVSWGSDPPTSPPGTVLDSMVATFHLIDGRPFVNAPVRWAVLYGDGALDTSGLASLAIVHPFAARTDQTGRTAAQAVIGPTPRRSLAIAASMLNESDPSGLAANASWEITWPVPKYYTSIAAGDITNCALTASGSAYCWGVGQEGELGIAAPPQWVLTPVLVSGGYSFTKIAVGGYDGCGITKTSQLVCWGEDSYGEIGQGDTATMRLPTVVPLPEAADSVVVGYRSVCALGVSGTAYCWGDNSSGQLGDGSLNSRSVPAPVSTAVRFKQLADLGAFAFCGVEATGAAWCWGDNSAGQLGSGGHTSQLTPGLVAGSHSFKSIAGGVSHGCGLDGAGTAWCWGANDVGQIGDGTQQDRLVPTAVAGGHVFASLSSGYGFESMCALDEGGTMYCWGDDNYWELGVGTPTDAPLQTCEYADGFFAVCATVPLQQRLRKPFVSSSIGGGWSDCGITLEGVAYCWGFGQYGALGDYPAGSGQTYGGNTVYPSVVEAPSATPDVLSNPEPARGGNARARAQFVRRIRQRPYSPGRP